MVSYLEAFIVCQTAFKLTDLSNSKIAIFAELANQSMDYDQRKDGKI